MRPACRPSGRPGRPVALRRSRRRIGSADDWVEGTPDLPPTLVGESRNFLGVPGNAPPGRLQRRNLVGRQPRAALDDRACVAHALARWGGLAGDKRHDGFGHSVADELRRPSPPPPISPISTTFSVPASSSKSPSTSMNDVPLTGSPPIPTHVEVPLPCCLRA